VEPGRPVEGLLVNYLHFYGGFDRVSDQPPLVSPRGTLHPAYAGHRPYQDAQGFRVGPESRRIRDA